MRRTRIALLICAMAVVVIAGSRAPAARPLHTTFKLLALLNGSTTTFDLSKPVAVPTPAGFPWSCMTTGIDRARNGTMVGGFGCFPGRSPNPNGPTIILRANCSTTKPDTGSAVADLGKNLDQASGDGALKLLALCITE